MVCHQHPGVDIYPMFTRIFCEPVTVGDVVFIGGKTNLPVIAPLNDVNWHTSRCDSCESGHRFHPIRLVFLTTLLTVELVRNI